MRTLSSVCACVKARRKISAVHGRSSAGQIRLRCVSEGFAAVLRERTKSLGPLGNYESRETETGIMSHWVPAVFAPSRSVRKPALNTKPRCFLCTDFQWFIDETYDCNVQGKILTRLARKSTKDIVQRSAVWFCHDSNSVHVQKASYFSCLVFRVCDIRSYS